MLPRTRLLACSLLVALMLCGNLFAQRSPNRHRGSGLTTKRIAAEKRTRDRKAAQRRVMQAQHALEMPPSPRYSLAQNPLDDLEDALDEATPDVNELFDDPGTEEASERLDDLDELLERNDRAQSEPARPRRSIDDILGNDDDDSSDSDGESANPLAGLDDDDDDNDEDNTNAARGLRNDDYYRDIGAPRVVRQQNRGPQPLTMENIFGDDDQYDPCCEKEYCRRMWNCAGGRCQNWWSRIQRDLDRSRLLRDSQCNCQQMYRNDFKCRKIPSQVGSGQQTGGCPTNGYGGQSYGDGYSDGYGGEYYNEGSYGGEQYDGTVYDNTQVFGDDAMMPTPADIPVTVDGN